VSKKWFWEKIETVPQVKCSWIFRHMFARAKDIDFPSAKKLKEMLDQKIEDLQQPQASNHTAATGSQPAHAAHAVRISTFKRRNGPREMDQLYAKLKQ